MLTAVYVLVSYGKDSYYEQALLSLYSLRQHNPNMNVVVLVDDTTEATLCGKRAEIRKYATEIKTVVVPADYTPKERSRYIKTTFRKLLSGNLLFIDTDTIITGNLDEIEQTDAEIACVLDYHAPLDCLIAGLQIKERIKQIFGQDVSDEKLYFNSGVIFLRDTASVYELFDVWHDFWKIATFKKGQCYDQPALLVADRKCGHIIKPLDGIYNCQILTSIQYLHKAKIIHFFNNVWEGKAKFSPFFQDCLYQEIKETGAISERIHQLVLDCKSAFFSPTYYVCTDQVRFLTSLVGCICYSLYKKNNFTYKLLLFLCKARFSLTTLFNHL